MISLEFHYFFAKFNYCTAGGIAPKIKNATTQGIFYHQNYDHCMSNR